MNKNTISFFIAMMIFMSGFIPISGAQTMQNENQRLNVKQENIVRIAALTAR